MKYIVTIQPNGTEEIFLFSRAINHDCMAQALMMIRNRMDENWLCVNRKPISAGFVQDGHCYGESMTLGLESRRKEDTELLLLSF